MQRELRHVHLHDHLHGQHLHHNVHRELPMRTHWNEDERNAVGARALPILVKMRESGTGDRASMFESVRQAQHVLPTQRRRHINGYDAVPRDLREQLDKAARLAQKLGRIPIDVEPAVPATAPAAPAPAPGATNAKEEVAVTPPASATPRAGTLEEAILAAAELVADQIAAATFERIKDRLQGLARTFVEQEAIVRPKILVVGPLPQQANRLREEFGKLLDLRFVASSEAPRRVGEVVASCQKGVVWTTFVNHAHVDQVPRDKRVLVGGGFDAVREALLKEAAST